jgi:RNA polymerase sigma-54 factor
MSLGQSLQQRLLQKLSPQQIQLMKLLQVPTANLEQRIKQEIEENPALELINDEPNPLETEEGMVDEFKNTDENEDYTQDNDGDEFGDLDINEYIAEGDDEIPDYKMNDGLYGGEEKTTMPVAVDVSFNELMLEQLNLLKLNERQAIIAEQVVGSLDEDGYLRRENTAISNDLAFRQGIEVTQTEIEEVIKIVQEFEPAGVAARNLRECLLIQIIRKDDQSPTNPIAYKIINKYFDEFTKKHYEKIQRSLGITPEQLKAAIALITKLNPKPAGNIGETLTTDHYIIPDFFVVNNSGKLELTLNSRNAPELNISGEYKDMLRHYEKGSKQDKRQKEAVMFIKQKIDSAKWFIDAIKQRQNTLTHTMGAIISHQEKFFLTGDEAYLKPMILKDIADVTQLDISTISRVANSKYVHTEYGTYKLKYFFNESLSTDSGEEVSTREVKNILQKLIEGESKARPLSDERLTEMLQEKGYNIARRTVAKYRENLNLPVARLRKEL